MKNRERCMGCGYFDNELSSGEPCEAYGPWGHYMLEVDKRGIAIHPKSRPETIEEEYYNETDGEACSCMNYMIRKRLTGEMVYFVAKADNEIEVHKGKEEWRELEPGELVLVTDADGNQGCVTIHPLSDLKYSRDVDPMMLYDWEKFSCSKCKGGKNRCKSKCPFVKGFDFKAAYKDPEA